MKFDKDEFINACNGKAYAGDRGTFHKGYHGLGDPDDKSLNEVDIKVLIPCWITDIIHRDYCSVENQEYQRCRESTHFFKRFYVCFDQKRKLNDCTEHWRSKLDLREQATAEFLEERRLFRSTGLNKCEREQNMEMSETKIDKIRSYVLSEEEMKQYKENLAKQK